MNRYLLIFSLLLPLPVSAQHPLDAAAGKALFERNWVAAPSSTAASDGLGPYFNARSCSTCHAGGGRGSSFQALLLRLDDAYYGQQLQTQALPGLTPEASLTLSYVSGSPEPEAPALRTLQVVTSLPAGLQETLSPRFAPSLRGMSVLAEISDQALLAAADPDDSDGDGISGRVSLVSGSLGDEPGIGRFGWKAEHVTLEQQIASAFSLDLGLGSPLYPSSHGDCSALQTACLQGVPGTVTGETGTEISEQVLSLIRSYLLSLPPVGTPADMPQGQGLFRELGCASCHVARLQDGQSGALYSDLLLHDMGQGLRAGIDTESAKASEWRTAPLKDLNKSEYLLHDGRAQSVDAAIRWHGGEAVAARQAYLQLDARQKSLLLDFLYAL